MINMMLDESLSLPDMRGFRADLMDAPCSITLRRANDLSVISAMRDEKLKAGDSSLKNERRPLGRRPSEFGSP